jgi:hypothetical protein
VFCIWYAASLHENGHKQGASSHAAASLCIRIVFSRERKAPGMTPMAKRYLFYGIKLPFMLLLIILGFMMEFIVVLPFAVLAQMDARRRCK